MNCRFCGNELKYEFIDLHNSPPSNSYLTVDQLNEPELYYPLKLLSAIIASCTDDEYKKSDDIFNENYAYFSSYSTSWLKHSEEYVTMIIKRLGLTSDSRVVEIASNDGYLLQYFVRNKIPCLGIEPTKSTADAARKKGIQVIEDFFGARLAEKIEKQDLILGNNVLALVPDINDFVKGLKKVLKPEGTITMEFPH
jgi:SAM-dependent methyltransferase